MGCKLRKSPQTSPSTRSLELRRQHLSGRPFSLGEGESWGGEARTAAVHQQPGPRQPLPPCSDDESVGRGSSLFHHPNCCVVCVHQGNSRDSKLNSNTQFIQDVRPVERLCRLPCPPARRLPACRSPPWSPGTEALRKGDSPWAAVQLHSHFTDGVAEAQRRVSRMETVLGTRWPAPARAGLSSGIVHDKVSVRHTLKMTNEPILNGSKGRGNLIRKTKSFLQHSLA